VNFCRIRTRKKYHRLGGWSATRGHHGNHPEKRHAAWWWPQRTFRCFQGALAQLSENMGKTWEKLLMIIERCIISRNCLEKTHGFLVSVSIYVYSWTSGCPLSPLWAALALRNLSHIRFWPFRISLTSSFGTAIEPKWRKFCLDLRIYKSISIYYNIYIYIIIYIDLKTWESEWFWM
jgi:hypothetical protein